jgi:hypothetical protein
MRVFRLLAGAYFVCKALAALGLGRSMPDAR